MEIRDASIKDAKEIIEIYRPFVEEMATSFEYELPSVEEFQKRISSTLENFPYLVAEIDGKIAGYAYAGFLRSRCAYGWSVEVTVYVSLNHQRVGVGKKLYLKLFEILRKQGAVNAFAGVTLPNDASVGLHEALGFEQIGVYKNIGFKNDCWWDVGWWQLSLQKLEKPKTLIKYLDLFL